MSIRVILLAESHVWTPEQEFLQNVFEPGGLVTQYVRFVYCLGYGESALVKGSIPNNRGTSQYWTLFHDTVYGPDFEGRILGRDRVSGKLELLAEMQKRGIWLVDASVVALYGNGPKINGKRYRELLRHCWEDHVGEVVRSCSPSGVLVVGQGVGNALNDVIHCLPGTIETKVAYQPQARMKSGCRAEWRQKIFDFCSRHAPRHHGESG